MKRGPIRPTIRHATFLLVCWALVGPAWPRSRPPRRKSSQLTAPAGGTCPGDLNLDKHRDIEDLNLLSQVLVGKQSVEGEALANADVDGDQKVDVADLGRLLQHLNGTHPMPKCEIFSPEQVACPGLALERDSAEPLEKIGVGRLPETFKSPVAALVMSADGSVGVFSIASLSEDGTATMTVPFYPAWTIQGGRVGVTLTDGHLACPAQDFTIESIPAAPGAFGSLVDSLQGLVAAKAQELGYSTEQLTAANLDQLPEFMYPLVVAQSLIDDPNNPNSLRAVSQGTAPALDGQTDLTMLNAMVAYLRLNDLIQDGSAQAMSTQVRVPTANPLDCLGISTAEQLSSCMEVAVSAEEALEEPPEGSAVAKLHEDVADTLEVLEFFPVIGEVVGEVKAAIGTASTLSPIAIAVKAWEFAEEAAANLLPTRLLSLDFDLNPASMEEDRPSGEWNKAMLLAVSKGWSVDPVEVLSSIYERALKTIEVAKFAPKWSELASSHLIEESPEEFDPRSESIEKIEEFIAGEPTKALIQHSGMDEEGSQIVVIDPRPFGPVDISDENWSEAHLKGGTIELVGHSQYAPVDDGTTDLIVRARTDGGRFGGVPSISTAKTVDVKPIKMSILKDGEKISTLIAKPGESFSLTVKMEDAFFPDAIEVEKPVDRTRLTVGSGEDLYDLEYTAPSSKDALPELLVVRDTATTGACAAPTGCGRTAVVDVEAEPDVLVTPFGECLDPGGPPFKFSAQVVGIENQAVTWNASSGQIDQNGDFTSDEPGTVTITATSQAYPDAVGAATVKVGGCDCYWILKADSANVSLSGDLMSFASTDAPVPSPDSISLITQAGPFTSISFNVSAANSQGIVQGNIGAGTNAFYGTTNDLAPASVVLTANDPKVEIAGSVTGQVHYEVVTSGEQKIIPFSALFRFKPGQTVGNTVHCTVH